MTNAHRSRNGHSPQVDERTYSVHGIRVSIASNWPDFLSLCDLLLGAFRDLEASEESLSVRAEIRARRWSESPSPAIPRSDSEVRLGTNEFLEGRIARHKEGRTFVEYEDGREARVVAVYELDRKSRLRQLLGGERPWADVFGLFRLAVQEPILLKLERRKAVLLHASATADGERAFVFIGLNGSGKSTLCASLLDRMAYLSDNFAVWDGKKVLGFPGALRMPMSPGIRTNGPPPIHGKVLVPVEGSNVRRTAEPYRLFFVSLGPKTVLTALTAEEAFAETLWVDSMTHEFPRHTYLGPLCPVPDLGRVEAFVRGTPAYRLVVSRTDEAKAAVLGVLSQNGTPDAQA
jgi:hypothetical protein